MMEMSSSTECQVQTVCPLKMVDVNRLLWGARVTMQHGLSKGKAIVALHSSSELTMEDATTRGPARFFAEAEDFNGAFLLALQTLVRYRSACGELPSA